MLKNKELDELTRIIARRSSCNVQVGAIIYDKYGIFSWGWNSSGPSGEGMHAEHHAISRANRSRLEGASIMVVSLRRNRQICSLPCPTCASRIVKVGIKKVTCANSDGEWITYHA